MAEINIEQFIENVQAKRAIWDKKSRDHSNRYYVETCWREIGQKMNIEEYKLKKKWKYLRDQFASELLKTKNIKSTDRNGDFKSSSKWIHFKSLLFLQEIIKPRRGIRNINKRQTQKMQKTDKLSNDEEDDDDGDDDDGDNGNNNKDDADYVINELIINSDRLLSEQQQQQRRDVKLNDSHLTTDTFGSESTIHLDTTMLSDYKEQKSSIANEQKSISNEPTIPKSEPNVEDEDLLFFKSILPHVKKIPAENVLSFRGKILQLLQDCAYPACSTYSTNTGNSSSFDAKS